MGIFTKLNVEISGQKHEDVKIISVKTNKSQKVLIDEALDFLREKYKQFLPQK